MAVVQERRKHKMLLMPSMITTQKNGALSKKTPAPALWYFTQLKCIPLNYFTLTQYNFYPLLSFSTHFNFIQTPTLK